MLFILTGGVQTGKTRWLEALVADLEACGVPSAGVIAPGVWREKNVPAQGSGREKIGIDNVLLPSATRIRFADRRDLLNARLCACAGPSSSDTAGEAGAGGTAESDRAQLGWAIYDDAIERVNGHFDTIKAGLPADCADGPNTRAPGCDERGWLLVVDEIGRLELEGGGGIVSAMAALDGGPSKRYPHALIVVRDWLFDRAEERFGPVWGGSAAIEPNDEGAARVAAAYGLNIVHAC